MKTLNQALYCTVEEIKMPKIRTADFLENSVSIHLGGLEYLGDNIYIGFTFFIFYQVF